MENNNIKTVETVGDAKLIADRIRSELNLCITSSVLKSLLLQIETLLEDIEKYPEKEEECLLEIDKIIEDHSNLQTEIIGID
jgi:hypothetical protein